MHKAQYMCLKWWLIYYTLHLFLSPIIYVDIFWGIIVDMDLTTHGHVFCN